MNKLPLLLVLMLLWAVSACSSAGAPAGQSGEANTAPAPEPTTAAKLTYQSETGPIEVPAEPKRVVVLSAFLSGSIMALNVPIVGVDSWSKSNPRYTPYIGSAAEVSEESLEKIIELNPDLIVAPSTAKNLDKLKALAPTVTYTYGKVDYLTQHLELGKLLNKEKEAQAWIDDFKKRAQAAGAEIKAKIGQDATVSVIESFEKQLYVFGDNWGRGTEILYQEMKLSMPEKVKETALKSGYYALSPEVLAEYAGDYVFFSKAPDADHSFQSTDTYKNIPAVKNNRVFEVNAKEFYYNDPLTLEYQLEVFKKSLLGK
ncbi:iron-hydroxamate ABC transporter substrate-binding protein [Paenibacillus sp. YYML68]|uniref:iron-hydroxamate ABC transporter substrate-binding protein n=1 Tax=Paenibacillus sp. YYML68 TaxID=2909250 RepID=UPI00248FA3FC|nr:iron-hydroxamate ABC transporter substrate-binding protein [Paenibacillus sp. YYML68]